MYVTTALSELFDLCEAGIFNFWIKYDSNVKIVKKYLK